MSASPPEPSPSRVPPGLPERLTLGLAFIASGAALGQWVAPFRIVGMMLILIGLGILGLGAWGPLQAIVQEHFGRRVARTWVVPLLGLGLIAITGVIGLAWWQVNEDQTPSRQTASPALVAAPPAVPAVSCIEAARRCEMFAEKRIPGEALVWILPRSLTSGAHDGVLRARTRLDGEVAGRYVALACRHTQDVSEYVLAVEPADQSFRLIRWDGDDMVELAAEWLPQTIHPANEPNDLELRCVGPRITGLINGTPVATTDDDHLPTGGWYVAAGVRARNTQAAAVSAVFDQIDMRPAMPTP